MFWCNIQQEKYHIREVEEVLVVDYIEKLSALWRLVQVRFRGRVWIPVTVKWCVENELYPVEMGDTMNVMLLPM